MSTIDILPTPRKRLLPRKLPLTELSLLAGSLGYATIIYLVFANAPDLEVRFSPRLQPLVEAGFWVQVHVGAAITTFIIGSAIFALPKGHASRVWHKRLGWTWVMTMAVTAISSFLLVGHNGGSFSWIHGLSAWTLVALPMAIAAIRRKNVKAHRKHMKVMFISGMLIAGLFSFLPGRMMWELFFTISVAG